MSTADSPRKQAWKKFRRNLPAMFGLAYLSFCLLIAVFAYLLAPDATRHANFQILELAKQPPGTSVWVLMQAQAGVESNDSWTWIFTGRKPRHIPLPLRDTASLQLSGHRVNFVSYIGTDESLPLSAFGETNDALTKQAFLNRHVQLRTFSLGTDDLGRDLLSRIMLGARVSLSVGAMAVLISLLIGIFLGTMAGYLGGWVDQLIMWGVSVMWALPTLLLALAFSFVLGKGFWQVFVAIGISMWVEVARIVRGQILSVRELTFTEAARALGFRHFRVMFRHVLPNVISPIIVIAVANFGAAVLIESGLSFLGIGVALPVPSWGSMISEGYTYIVFENGKWLAFFPGMALILLVVSINLVGIGLRDAWDVNL